MASSDGSNSFLSHLEALRALLLKSLAAVAVLLLPAFYCANEVMNRLLAYLSRPLNGEGPTLQFHFFSPLEPFLVQLKLSLLLALFGALPYVSLQVARFVAPALYSHERRALRWLAGMISVLFLIGAAFAFFLVLPLLLNFARSYSTPQLTPMLGLANFVELAGLLLLGFGLMFQLPVVTLLLVKTGVVRVATLRKQRPVILIVILALAAILTPPDVLSQLLMAIPTWLLFEAALLIAARIEPPEPPEPPSPGAGTAAGTAESDHTAAEEPEEDSGYDPYAKARRPRRRKLRPTGMRH